MLTLVKRTGGIDTSDATAGPYQILEGYSGYVDDERIEGTMPNRGKHVYSLPVNSSYNIPDGWHNGEGQIVQNLATQGTIVVTPGTTPRLICAADRWTTGDLYIAGDSDLVAGNVKVGTTLFGVTGTYRGCVTTDATVGASVILSGYSAYGSAGTKIAGTMPNNGTTNHSLALDGSYTIPAGWHNGNGKVTQSLSTQPGWTATPSTGNILLCSANKLATGDVKVAGSSNLVAGNIKKGTTIFGVTGTYEAELIFDEGTMAWKVGCSGEAGFTNNRNGCYARWWGSPGGYIMGMDCPALANCVFWSWGGYEASYPARGAVTKEFVIPSGKYVDIDAWTWNDTYHTAGKILFYASIYGTNDHINLHAARQWQAIWTSQANAKTSKTLCIWPQNDGYSWYRIFMYADSQHATHAEAGVDKMWFGPWIAG